MVDTCFLHIEAKVMRQSERTSYVDSVLGKPRYKNGKPIKPTRNPGYGLTGKRLTGKVLVDMGGSDTAAVINKAAVRIGHNGGPRE